MKFKNGFGLTTAVLLPFFNDLLEDTLKTIEWAKENGFSWVEVRDKNVELSKCDADKIRNFANKNTMKVFLTISLPHRFPPKIPEFLPKICLKFYHLIYRIL